jgi:hypothetical protein
LTLPLWDDLWGDSEKELAPVASYNSNKLARYFQDKYQSAPWNTGFGIVNQRALAGTFAKWKGKHDPKTITAMIDLYMEDERFRGKNPGWSDFLFHAEQLGKAVLGMARTILYTGEKSQPKDRWTMMQEEWERQHGGDE